MEIQPDKRTANLSAGELANFGQQDTSPAAGRAPAWRTALGTAWHNDLRTQTTQTHSGARFEVPLSATLSHHGWSLTIQGRIDQLIPHNDGWIIREVKTIGEPLPLPEHELLQKRLPHFLQLACYLALAARDTSLQDYTSLSGEVTFVDYRSGVIQTIPLPAHGPDLLEAQLTRLTSFLEARRTHHLRLRQLVIPPAFAELRPEQVQALSRLRPALAEGGIHAFQAPTGFGKTGVALQAALEQIRDGHCDRLIFLTGKTSGQLQVLKQLESLAHNNPQAPRALHLRPKAEHIRRCPVPHCDGRQSCGDSLRTHSTLHPLLDGAIATHSDQTPRSILRLEDSLSAAAQSGICPFELSRAALPGAEVWVCDYNYIFSPRHQRFFENLPDCTPTNACLIVDEAHNLPTRVADNFSFAVSSHQASHLADSLAWHQLPAKLTAAWERWSDFLHSLKPSDQHEGLVAYQAADLLETLAEATNQPGIDWESLPPATADLLNEPSWQLDILRNERLQLLLWSRSPGELRVDCLDASPLIAERLQFHRAALLMSATLDPVDHFAQSLGLTASSLPTIRAGSPWRSSSYQVAIDARVDTSYRQRASYYALTASTLVELTNLTAPPIAVFFPSYHYAETLRTYLQAEAPGLIVSMQPRTAEPDGQLRFIEESLLTAHLLFFILGSSFSESIDLLGGRVETAVVVGPALPEVNPLQKARMATSTSRDRSTAAREVYIIPAMRKINQALGRLVRAPGHRARVLLHCRRFRDPAYLDCLDPDFNPSHCIRADDELHSWWHGQLPPA